MRGRGLGWLLAAAIGAPGCSFIDDFDYTFVPEDAGPVGLDGGVAGDGGTGSRDASTTPDAGGPRACDDPCLSDAILDFDEAAQGTGDFQWRYRQDFRDEDGLSYGDLVASDVMGIPGWSDDTPPPAIASCADQAGNSTCSVAGRRLLMLANDPGAGGDPVLGFEAPEEGNYRIDVAHVGNGDQMQLLVSRNARHDMFSLSSFLPSSSEARFSVPVELLLGDQVLVTARPAPGVAAAGQLGVDVRIVRDLSAEPLGECMLTVRFEDSSPFNDDCGTSLAEDTEAGNPDETTAIAGPNEALGAARDFDVGSLMRIPSARFDYSGDFTFQLWARIDSNNFFSTAIYVDWSAFDPATTGGISLSIDPNDGMGNDDIITAGFLVRDLANVLPSVPPTVDCDSDDEYCTGTIVAPIPSFAEWHFYRIVRDTAEDEFRFCIDGVEVGSAPLDGDADISNPRSPALGGFDVGSFDPTFNGAIDDLRILRRALPCSAPE